MAAQFTGLQMLVTVSDPPAKLRGTVSDVEAGSSLTLSNGSFWLPYSINIYKVAADKYSNTVALSMDTGYQSLGAAHHNPRKKHRRPY